MTRKHLIRQALLSALADIYPGGRSVVSLQTTADLAGIKELHLPELLAEVAVLEAGDFIVDIRKGRGDGSYYKITLHGLLQIKRETDLDETVWGEGAL